MSDNVLAIFACMMALSIVGGSVVAKDLNQQPSPGRSRVVLTVDGIQIALVRVSSGRFVMGAKQPAEPDWSLCNREKNKGVILLLLGTALCLLSLGAVVVYRRLRGRWQYSIRQCWVVVIAISLLSWGFISLRNSRETRARLEEEDKIAMYLYRMAKQNEKPPHPVTITKPFLISECEVSQKLYARIMGRNPSAFKGENLPVDNVEWEEAAEFCRKLSGLLRRTVRLPTEAEWEYVCRLDYRNDAELSIEYWLNLGQTPKEVGTTREGKLGIYDMLGNVWEWTSDWYGPYEDSSQIDPKGPPQGRFRVFRGGSYREYRERRRPTARPAFARPTFHLPLKGEYHSVGIRLVVELDALAQGDERRSPTSEGP